MNVKKKTVIIAVCCMVILLIACVTMTIVMVTGNYSINSRNILIRYETTDVHVLASANYYIAGNERVNMVDASNANNTTIELSSSNASGTLVTNEEIMLTKDKQFVVFEYIFANQDDATGVNISLTSSVNGSNIILRYDQGSSDTFAQGLSKGSGTAEAVFDSVDVGSVSYICIIASIENEYKSVDGFECSFTWNLTRVE